MRACVWDKDGEVCSGGSVSTSLLCISAARIEVTCLCVACMLG